MRTLLTASPREAAKVIAAGGVVAFPTETVYGLGANVFNADAVARIFDAKQRPADNPLIAHVGTFEQINELASEIPSSAAKFIRAFFPGPLTIVLRRSDRVPLIATAGLDTIGVRMPRHPIARDFLKECGSPVVAPSANISGKPSPTTWEAVYEDLNGRIDCILQGDATEIGLESTVVDCTTPVPAVLRSGAVSLQELQSVVPGTEFSEIAPDGTPRSPGMKHRHYSPKAKVVIVDSPPIGTSESSAYIGIGDTGEFSHAISCADVDEYARQIFEFFRECDRRGTGTIYCQAVPEVGIGAAVMDRIRRAAAG